MRPCLGVCKSPTIARPWILGLCPISSNMPFRVAAWPSSSPTPEAHDVSTTTRQSHRPDEVRVSASTSDGRASVDAYTRSTGQLQRGKDVAYPLISTRWRLQPPPLGKAVPSNRIARAPIRDAGPELKTADRMVRLLNVWQGPPILCIFPSAVGSDLGMAESKTVQDKRGPRVCLPPRHEMLRHTA